VKAGWVLTDAGHQRQGVDNWERIQFRLGSYHAFPADTYYPTRNVRHAAGPSGLMGFIVPQEDFESNNLLLAKSLLHGPLLI
jgi:hypothetical protein